MSTLIEADARLTSQNQLTLPASVRKALKVKGGEDSLRFRVLKGGKVEVVVASPREEPALGPFLELLENDFRKRPKKIRSLSPRLVQRAAALVKGVKVDLNAPLSGED